MYIKMEQRRKWRRWREPPPTMQLREEMRVKSIRSR